MDHRSYRPQPDLSALVKCHWTLEVPAEMSGTRQRILPDGCIDMIFILGDDIRRITPDGGFVLQPRAMVLGQITEAFDVEPQGYVNSFAVRFHPHGFSNFVTKPIRELTNKETPLGEVLGKDVADALEQRMIHAGGTEERIALAESFLLNKLNDRSMVDQLIDRTVDAILASKGSARIGSIVQDDPAERRKLERMFRDRVGVSPKQLSKVIRLQAALRLMLERQDEKLTHIAYDSAYYDQAHFIKDFREFTGMSPKGFIGSDMMALSAVLYKEEPPGDPEG